jgi:hypothetical protein
LDSKELLDSNAGPGFASFAFTGPEAECLADAMKLYGVESKTFNGGIYYETAFVTCGSAEFLFNSSDVSCFFKMKVNSP